MKAEESRCCWPHQLRFRQPHPKETFVNALPRGHRTATRIDPSARSSDDGAPSAQCISGPCDGGGRSRSRIRRDSGVVGSYTGMEDVGTATLNECVQIAGWIARSVGFPVILDGDTGHGGIMAVRRMVEDCIREGIAGVRIDDQPIKEKRGTGTADVEVQLLDVVLTRYRAAVDRKRELTRTSW
ncbi:MAG TPA: hypothetical protein EYM75_01410 [Dehalococcoidia bacterium]|nr:hypothetical protein [Dehalococcoidia bacterium]